METLMAKAKFILGILIILSVSSHAQDDYTSIHEAFKNSYSYENAGEYSKAIESIKKIYKEDSYEINLRLGWLHYMAGKFSESIGYYNNAITLKPLSIEAKLGIAYPSSAMGNWSSVITQYKNILSIDPENSLTLYRLASVYYGQKKYEEAYNSLEKVANHYPFDYDTIILFAWINFQMGKTREAKVLFNKALMIKPGDESALEGLSLIK